MLCVFRQLRREKERHKDSRKGRRGERRGGGSKAQKDKPAGPSHTLEGGWACSCSHPSQGGLLKTLWTCPQPPLGGGGGCGGEEGGERRFV